MTEEVSERMSALRHFVTSKVISAIAKELEGSTVGGVKDLEETSAGTVKQQLFDALETHLNRQLEETTAASRDAAAYATDEESRADSKWDTQGLEASYLAAGQASHARELKAALEMLKQYRTQLIAPQSAVGVGALVTCEVEGMQDRYYLVPVAGGIDLDVGGIAVTTISLQTPVGQALRNKEAETTYRLANGLQGRVIAVQ